MLEIYAESLITATRLDRRPRPEAPIVPLRRGWLWRLIYGR